MNIKSRLSCLSAMLGPMLLGIATPAHAALPVFDPTNYVQNVLTASRTLTQINNQIRSLQNEADMIIGMAKNLSRISFPQLTAMKAKLQEIDRLIATARGIDFRVASIDAQLRRLFPGATGRAFTSDTAVAEARSRLDAALDAFRQTMAVQSQIVGNVEADATTLTDIVNQSQGSEGALQVGQATNQLLALAAKQQFQLQNLMAVQFRSEAVEQSRRLQAEQDAQIATRKFLGSGHAYTPH